MKRRKKTGRGISDESYNQELDQKIADSINELNATSVKNPTPEDKECQEEFEQKLLEAVAQRYLGYDGFAEAKAVEEILNKINLPSEWLAQELRVHMDVLQNQEARDLSDLAAQPTVILSIPDEDEAGIIKQIRKQDFKEFENIFPINDLDDELN